MRPSLPRKLLLALLASSSCVLLPLSASLSYGEETDKTLTLYVLTGQSNMCGRDTAKTPTTDIAPVSGTSSVTHIADSSVPIWNYMTPNNGGNVSHLSSGHWDTIHAYGNYGQDGIYWGPEVGMARSMYDQGMRDFALIKVAQGGTPNQSWVRTDDGKGGVSMGSGGAANPNMYYNLYQSICLAIQNLPAGYTSVEIAGLGYLQGESNDSVGGAAAAQRLQDLVSNLKADLALLSVEGITLNAESLKIVIAQPSQQASGNVAAQTETDAQFKELAAANPDFELIATRGLPIYSDPYSVHYTADGQIVIGERMAQAFLTLGTYQVAEKEDFLWQGGSTGSWNAAAVWQDGLSQSLSWKDISSETPKRALFGLGVTQISLEEQVTAAGISFLDSSTLTSATKLLTLTSGAEVSVAADKEATLRAAVNFTYGFSKTGTGTLVMDNAQTHLLGLDITVGAGVLSLVNFTGITSPLSAGNGFTEGLGIFRIQEGATLAFNVSSALTIHNSFEGAGILSVGSQNLTLIGDVSGFSGGLLLRGGALTLNSASALTVTKGTTLQSNTTLAGSGAISLAGGLNTGSYTLTLGNTAGVTLVGDTVFGGSTGASLVLNTNAKLLLGGNLTLGSAFVYGQAAKTTTSAGVLSLSSGSKLSSDSLSERTILGSVLALGGTVSPTITLGDTLNKGTLNLEMLQLNGGAAGPLLQVLSDVSTQYAVIGGTSVTFDVGGTTGSEVTLDIGRLWMANNASALVKQGAGTLTIRGVDTQVLSPFGVTSRALNVQKGTLDFCFQDGDVFSWDSVISGSGAWQKSGEGVLNLNISHTNTGGFTLKGGQVNVLGINALGTGDFVVEAGTARLSASQNVASTTVKKGGRLELSGQGNLGSSSAQVRVEGGTLVGKGGILGNALLVSSGELKSLGTRVEKQTVEWRKSSLFQETLCFDSSYIRAENATLNVISVTLKGGTSLDLTQSTFVDVQREYVSSQAFSPAQSSLFALEVGSSLSITGSLVLNFREDMLSRYGAGSTLTLDLFRGVKGSVFDFSGLENLTLRVEKTAGLYENFLVLVQNADKDLFKHLQQTGQLSVYFVDDTPESAKAVIPESSSVSLGLIGLCSLLWWRRRRVNE